MTECGGRPAGESASSELSRCSPIVEWPRRDCYLNPRGKVVFCRQESLPTLRGLADWVRSTPMVVRGRKRVLADLERMEQILERAAREGIEWHLTLDI